MSTKKSSKKSSSKKSSSKKSTKTSSATNKALILAAKAGDASGAVMAVSATATSADAKESAILNCLIQCFFQNGLPPISPSAKIVWETIPDNIITIIGKCVRDCINGKGFQSPGWSGPFQALKDQGMTSVVADLVKGMATVVKP